MADEVGTTQASPAVHTRVAGLAMIPLAFLVHNVEEALTIDGALPHLSLAVTRILGHSIELPSASQYRLALVLVTVLAFGVYGLARLWDRWAYALIVLQAVMALNVLSHTVGAIVLGGYAPGVVTAWAVEAPTSWYVYRQLKHDNWMSALQWRLLAPLVVLIHGPLLVGLLRLFRKL